MMVKNEHKRFHVTLNSVVGYVKSFVMFDTGSTDDTIEIAETFCKKNNITFRLKQGDFVDFAKSRNECLEFAEMFPDIDYYLLMDANDELRGGKILVEQALKYKKKPNTGFLLCQEWWSGKYDKYYNMRFLKAKEGWRYKMRVHEWLKNTKYPSDEEAPPPEYLKIPGLVLYQDRTQDDDKSGKRFSRDKELLLEDYYDSPEEPRIIFYLAQTCGCLNQRDEAFYYYKLRTQFDGFWEEKFHAFFRCGELAGELGHPWKEVFGWYMQAFEYSNRVEPMIKIIEHYREQKSWLLAFQFADLACKLEYPEYASLFVDKKAYDYYRWQLLGICGFYSGFHKEGKIGAQRALASEFKNEVDENNIKHYDQKEKLDMTKQEFVNKKCEEFWILNPRLTQYQVEKKANSLWKLREKQLEKERIERERQELLKRDKEEKKKKEEEEKQKIMNRKKLKKKK